ncbi:hypothetical protein KIK06_28685 [Nocardiopsis sp. EMB25]|uniref:hypothetical protein n=1 Tax=Nocardiopsis sp. EMB25 TaxID=2835867 RepID=UPI00228525DC|nr:hypothetical protein [Nocardiopsis sp. EMB25]MCY9787860.1 hypothetical protein [Nocardiopsis sp. EMB25]
MRPTFRRIAALLCLLALTGSLAAVGVHQPPAHASAQIAEAAEALADGPGVWAADDFGATLTPETIALVEEAYDRSEVPIRLALVTEDVDGQWEDHLTAEAFAAAVGEPGVYLVHGETGAALSEPEVEQSWAVIGDATTPEEIEDLFYLHPYAGLLTGVPDLVNGEVSSGLRALADGGGVYVDPVVSAVFPEIDAEAIETALEGAGDVRFGVVSGVAAPGNEKDRGELYGAIERSLALDMLEGADRDAMVVLLSWNGEAFRPVAASGPEAMEAAEIEDLFWGSMAPEQAIPAARVMGAILGPGVIEQAGVALAEDVLYVHPSVSDGLTGAEFSRAAENVADYPGDLRVAILPSQAVERALGDNVALFANEVAAVLAEGTDGDVVVYSVDPLGAVPPMVSETDPFSAPDRFLEDDDGAREILADFEEEGGSFWESLLSWWMGPPWWKAVLSIIVLGILLCCWPLIPIGLSDLYKTLKARRAAGDRGRTRGNRRGRSARGIRPVVRSVVGAVAMKALTLLASADRAPAAERQRRRAAERERATQDGERAARDAAWVERMRPRTDEMITELGEVLAQAPTPEPDRLDEFERLMNAYTELRDACRDAGTRSEMDRVRNRARRTLKRARTHAENPRE